MGGNKDMWLALGDPMLAKLTGNDWAQDHNREINTTAAAAALIAAMLFSGGTAAGIGAGAVEGEAAAAGAAGAGAVGAGEAAAGAGAGLTASEIAALDAAGGYTTAMGAVDGAAMGAEGSYATAAALDPYMVGAANAAGSAAVDPYMAGAAANGGLLSADTAFPAYTSAMELEAGGGGTGGLLGSGTSAPGDSMTAAKGMSTWDRIGKGFDTYNKYSKIAGGAQNMLAPPQQPQTPQPKPLTMRQAQQQQGPTDWAAVFGPGLSDEEIRKRQLMMMQYGYGAR